MCSLWSFVYSMMHEFLHFTAGYILYNCVCDLDELNDIAMDRMPSFLKRDVAMNSNSECAQININTLIVYNKSLKYPTK